MPSPNTHTKTPHAHYHLDKCEELIVAVHNRVRLLATHLTAHVILPESRGVNRGKPTTLLPLDTRLSKVQADIVGIDSMLCRIIHAYTQEITKKSKAD